jgi:hypothetical protein
MIQCITKEITDFTKAKINVSLIHMQLTEFKNFLVSGKIILLVMILCTGLVFVVTNLQFCFKRIILYKSMHINNKTSHHPIEKLAFYSEFWFSNFKLNEILRYYT